MVDHDDEALARLRASDPATGSHPDLRTLRARIAGKAPDSLGADRATAVPDEVWRGSRGATLPWVAATVALALGMGSGGYVLGARGGEDPGVVAAREADAGPAVDDALPGLSPGAQPVQDMEGSLPASEDGVPTSGGTVEGANYDPGPVRLVAGEDLPEERTTAEVRTLVSDLDAEEFLADWARSLGLDGAGVVEADDLWGAGQGLYDPATGRMLSVHAADGGALNYSYEDSYRSPWCREMVPSDEEGRAQMAQEWTDAMGPDVPMPDPANCREVAGETPTPDQAVAAARDFLTGTGVVGEDWDLVAPGWDDPTSGTVAVEGRPAASSFQELSVTVTVGPEGVVSAWGVTGEPTSLGTYPVISPVEAVQRHGRREFSVDYGVSILEDLSGATDDGASTSMPYPEHELPGPTPPEPGMKIPMLLKDKTVTAAELVRGTMWTQTGGSLEVPVWKLLTGDGMHYTVMAVADEAIDWQSWE
ncbi:hypothetical protein [Ornithinimicrobium kibberense]|uniref:Uncharacterized protein n=1 Tax=Ornithinimicrobium kibberense TaxID=282060 RepID=A0ABV5V2N4_9MICO|nr:hypothetical protein [Ornithinimicrobium kibberense]